VGIGDGIALGFNVGLEEGMKEGIYVGSWEGAAVDGDSDGLVLDACVGKELASLVGNCDGTALGNTSIRRHNPSGVIAFDPYPSYPPSE